MGRDTGATVHLVGVAYSFRVLIVIKLLTLSQERVSKVLLLNSSSSVSGRVTFNFKGSVDIGSAETLIARGESSSSEIS